MLVHSRITSVYLARRIRLFQAYSNKPNTQLQETHNQQWFSNLTVQRIKQWICKLGQNLENSHVELSKIKSLIDSVQNQIIQRTSTQIIQIIHLALYFQSPSKISNTFYYLCRKSYKFRNQLSRFLSKNWLDSQKKPLLNKYPKHIRQKIAIILTDLFIFGVYMTQNQFINNVLPLAFDGKLIQNKGQYLDMHFQFDYICHYVMILTNPQILLERNRNKILEIFYIWLKQIIDNRLGSLKIQMQRRLKQLQILYVSLQQGKVQIKQKQCQYIEWVRKFETIRKHLINTLAVIINSKQTNIHIDYTIVNTCQFQQLLTRIQVNYLSIISDSENENRQNKEQEFNQNIQSDVNHKENTDKSSDNSSTSSMAKHTIDQQKILIQIYDNCKHYKKRDLFVKDILYTQPFSLSKSHINSGEQFRVIQQLPQSYLETLRNCTTIECSNQLTQQFLYQFNKHNNRLKIVSVIFKELYDRNNIDFIIRCLNGIYLVEKEQISQFINEELVSLENRVSGYSYNRISNSQYGKYSNLVIQLIKFQFINQKKYMWGLLEEIKSMKGIEQSNSYNQIQNINIKSTNTQRLTLIQVMNLLQRLGRHMYYKSLDTHILMNKIIIQVYYHIKTRVIGYDIDTINRFNGLVIYLQSLKNDKQNKDNINILPISELKDDRAFSYVIKKLQKQLKDNFKDTSGKNGIARVCDMLANSIKGQNYISSYLYAELIYKINSKKLDEQIKKITKDNIIENISLGNYQGAANWGRFFGQLHRSNICQQNQLISFLEDVLIDQFIDTHISAVVKVICTTIQACSTYMKGTKKISQISQILTFLLVLKKQLLRAKGLSNSILQQQIADIMQFFHPAFTHVTTVQECISLQIKFIQSSNIERLMDNYERQYQLKLKQQSQKIKEKAINGFYCEEDDQKKLKFRQDHAKSPQKLRLLNKLQEQNFQKQLYELETNTSMIEKETSSRTSQIMIQLVDASEKKPKKLKVIARSKNGTKNIQKRQITLI